MLNIICYDGCLLLIVLAKRKSLFCFQVYSGQSTGGQYAMGSTSVPGYNVPMEQLPAMNQTGTPMAGQPPR